MKRKALKLKRCKQCKANFAPNNSMQKVCSPDCAIRFAQAETKTKGDKDHLKRKREFRANDTSAQKKNAQTAFNAYIRYRDKDLGCVSCDKSKNWGGKWNAGHFKTVGARSDLRFNEDNCHKQCEQCNNFLSGHLSNYFVELVKRIGRVRVEKLEKVEVIKRSALDYAEIAKTYRAKLRDLKEI